LFIPFAPEKLFEEDDRRKVPAVHCDKVARILMRLNNEASKVQDLACPDIVFTH
jgi:hypothetical protein